MITDIIPTIRFITSDKKWISIDIARAVFGSILKNISEPETAPWKTPTEVGVRLRVILKYAEDRQIITTKIEVLSIKDVTPSQYCNNENNQIIITQKTISFRFFLSSKRVNKVENFIK